MQAAIKENKELGGVVDDNLTRKGHILVSRISFIAKPNLLVRSSDSMVLKEQFGALQISLNTEQIENINEQIENINGTNREH